MAGMLAEGARRLAQGRLVAFPTETVYGLGADAENPAAIAAIYAAKGRPSNHPVIVHVSPEADLSYWASSIPAQARALIQAFWPGPLTLILPRAAHVPAAVSGGQDSVGLRCPSHPVAQALLREFARLKPSGQGGVAAPSANKFGQVSPTLAAHVRAEFPELDDEALLVLEGGPSRVGIESTIVDLSRLGQGIGPVLLRPGGITAAQLAEVLGCEPMRPDAAAPRVSGSLKAHYAPRTPLSIVTREAIEQMARRGSAGHAVAVVFDSPPQAGAPTAGKQALSWHVCPRDPETYARNLYAMLRELDAQGYRHIYLEAPPRDEAWRAVNDRIGRAAAAFD
ncbi:threonylcarbamoyl-AMP synthase [Pusillimonas sp. TS35]|nr:L-threonylcarbamoyladenylate synthase [Paracandidimonas lactea]MYN13205.1 threonylcarbamoyl-AMP synthase [Pusillimonas sp. TS35]